MLMLPLPFFIAFALGFYLLRDLLTEREEGFARRGFRCLIALCILQALLMGLIWGYRIEPLRKVLPVTASLLPFVAWLSFRSLAGPQPAPGPITIALQFLPPLAIILALALIPEAVDFLLIMVFAAYAIALWRIGGTSPDALAFNAFQDTGRIHRAIRLAALALAANAAVDVAIFADYALAAGRHVPVLLSVFSVAILLALGALAILGSEVNRDPESQEPVPDTAPSENIPDDLDNTAGRIEAFLSESRFYTQPDLTLSRLSRRLGLPARQISLAVNRLHGVNVSQYINSFRLDEACRLLAETNLSVTEIHLQAGFQTKSNFNREFRRRFGQSPSEWRQSHRNQALKHAL